MDIWIVAGLYAVIAFLALIVLACSGARTRCGFDDPRNIYLQ